MKQFRLVDNILGWVTFLIAAVVYCSTIEPTASFWDCPEFITTGYKLEIGHPPGAPFFMLTANLFSQFASDPTQVAKMVNIMSALLSATCILFLFWSVTHLTRKLLVDDVVYVVICIFWLRCIFASFSSISIFWVVTLVILIYWYWVRTSTNCTIICIV